MTLALETYGMFPCTSGWGTQAFNKKKHPAIDIGWLNKYGEHVPVVAWKSGVVVATGTDGAGGVYVVLKHDDVDCTWITRYWHFKKGSVVVKKGQTVKQGDKLGLRGNTGISTGTHLHFEIWKCPKGYTYKSSDASKYAVDPSKITFVFEGQFFDPRSEFQLSAKPEELEEPKPVAIDPTKHQVEVIADVLRVRETPSLNGNQLFMADKGVYNVIQTKEADGYLWYEIETDRWIATKEGSWTIDKPITKTPTHEEELASLQAQIDKLKVELELKEKALVATENALKDALKMVEDVRKAVL